MRVHVDKAGQEEFPLAVDNLGTCRPALPTLLDPNDAVTYDHHAGIRESLVAPTIQHRDMINNRGTLRAPCRRLCARTEKQNRTPKC